MEILGYVGAMVQFKVFEEFYPLPQSASNDSITADFVDCGYGLIHEASGRNDFADYPDLSGKICVMRLGYMNEASEPNNPLKDVADIQTKIKSFWSSPPEILFRPFAEKSKPKSFA